MSSIRKNPVVSTTAAAVAPPARRRLAASEREQQIIDGALEFFSEHGLGGQLRDLARQLGITHNLLYHYFATKQALIERVYVQVFAGRWRPEWETLLDDESLDIQTKLTRFYREYADVILKPNWVRIFVFSGLSDRYITDRYFSLLREKLFPRVVRETRKFRGVSEQGESSGRELELLMGLHGSIFYMGMRRWIYGHASPVPVDSSASSAGELTDDLYIQDQVRSYLLSLGPILDQGRQKHGKHVKPATSLRADTTPSNQPPLVPESTP